MAALLQYLQNKSGALRIGNYSFLAADTNGNPSHLTGGMLMLAGEKFITSGLRETTVTTGSTIVTISKLN